jgi:hypothetical protein
MLNIDNKNVISEGEGTAHISFLKRIFMIFLLELSPLNSKSHTIYLQSLEAPDRSSMHVDSLHQILGSNIFFDHFTFACLITAHYIISIICGNLHAYVRTIMNNDDASEHCSFRCPLSSISN